MDINKWDLRFLNIAKEMANCSKDPSTKVGAVIVDAQNRIVSAGFNGFPQKISDDTYRLNDRELKYKYTIHAEANALLFSKRDIQGHVIYVYPFMPCAECTKMIIQCGISKVVSYKTTEEKLIRWKDTFELAQELLEEAGVELVLYDNE